MAKGNVLICTAPFYRWENGGTECWSHETAFLTQELGEVGLYPSSREFQSNGPCVSTAPRGKQPDKRLMKEECACDHGKGLSTGSGRRMGGRRMGKRKTEEWVSPALFPTSLGMERVLTFVTEEPGSVRMICVCHRSWWKHPKQWGIGRVHPDKWWLKR